WRRGARLARRPRRRGVRLVRPVSRVANPSLALPLRSLQHGDTHMTHRKKFHGAACALACAMAFCTPAFAGQPASHAATTGSVDRAQVLAARQAAVDHAMALIEGPARKLVHRAPGGAIAPGPAAVPPDADRPAHA